MAATKKPIKPIKVELFALCDGAFNNAGRLTIVNTMDDLVSKTFPARFTFGLAFKFFVQPEVEGEKELSIAIEDEDGNNIIAPIIKARMCLAKSEKESHIVLAINMQNVLFFKEGKHFVRLQIDGERFDDFSFEVIKQHDKK